MAKTRSPITDAAAAFLEAGRIADSERAARHRHPARHVRTPDDDSLLWTRGIPFPSI